MKSMKSLFALVLAFGLTGPAWSADWDASTRRTNTTVQDGDIQKALTQGLSQQFTRAFPSSRFGIYVLVDRNRVAALNRDMVYASLGLCKRRGDGSYELPIVTYSTNLPLNNPANERTEMTQRLAQQAAEFSKLVVENAGRIQ
jgi:hypothetical protein